MKLHTVPGKDHLAASFGEHWILLDSKTGALLQSSPAQVIDKKSDIAIRCLVVSNDQKAVIARNDKTLQLWDLATGSLLCSTTSIKRINTIQFTKDSSRIILGIENLLTIGDKTGDIYSIATAEFEKGDYKLLAGHFSLILDLCFSPDESQIISAERDEKIRVSKFPHSYCIDSFCLGHTVYSSFL
jgi:tRNA (guanine-N(7)-)-methyltransferase subunit TRM82